MTPINLPEISSYSKKELEEFKNFSSAATIYLDLIAENKLNATYKKRHEAWLKVALSNFHHKSNQQERSLFWSQSMDEIVTEIFNIYFSTSDPVMLLALGKWGSNVLNLSSDIDVVLITNASNTHDLIKKSRNFIQHLNAKTPEGFITRVDLNLKPSDQTGTLINSKYLTNYLWNSSELWERLAYTRARKICGHIEDEASLFNEINKFCYRKYIRMDLVEDLSILLSKILNHNQDENNIKLCAGGIRSIELFVAAVQLLYGGRDLALQNANTYDVLNSLLHSGLFNKQAMIQLIANYNELRTFEDQIQSALDEQNHQTDRIIDLKNNLDSNQIFIQKFLTSISPKKLKDTHFLGQLESDSIEFPHLKDFINFLKKHHSYITLFEAHPKSYHNLLMALTYSPQITKLVLLRPDLLDVFLLQKINFEDTDNDEDFLIKLSDFKSISQITAIGEYLTAFDLNKLTLKSSKTADFCVSKILDRIFINEDIDVLKLGKWSADELGIFSDLDFVLTYSGTADLTKPVRKFIHYLTHSTFHGVFYNIDLRLRPSGNAGPILTSNQKIIHFLENSSPIWLKQAYLRNHLLKSNQTLTFKLQDLTDEDRAEILSIREKRFFNATELKPLSLKESLGGLVDLEFLIQVLYLNTKKFPKTDKFENQVDELNQLGILSDEDAKIFKKSYLILRQIEQTSDILIKNSSISQQSFQKLLSLPHFKLILPELNQYKDLVDLLNKNQLLIEKNHPFI